MGKPREVGSKKFFDTRTLSSAFSETKGPKNPGNLCLGVQDTLLVRSFDYI